MHGRFGKDDIIHLLQTYIIYLEKQKDETTFCENQNCIEQNMKGGNHPKIAMFGGSGGVTLRYRHRPLGTTKHTFQAVTKNAWNRYCGM